VDATIVKNVIEIVAIFMWPLGFGALIWQRVKTGKSIGARTIQITTIVLLFPALLILGLERVLQPETVGTLLGAIAGFVLSRVGDFMPGGSKTASDRPG